MNKSRRCGGEKGANGVRRRVGREAAAGELSTDVLLLHEDVQASGGAPISGGSGAGFVSNKRSRQASEGMSRIVLKVG